MYPLLRSRWAAPLALISLAISCVFALLVFTIGASPKVAPTDGLSNVASAPVSAVADVEEPQASSTSTKSDRLPLLPRSSPPAPPPAAEPEPPRPAEPFDYAQAEAEQVRSAHAEAPDLCQRHGMHKHHFKVGRRESWRCER